jgi:hypothetical protein
MDSDSPAIVEKLIGCGVYQAWHFILFQWITVLQACNIAFMVFGKYIPQFDCDSDCAPFLVTSVGSKDVGQAHFDVNNNSGDEDLILKCKNASISHHLVQFHSIAVEVSVTVQDNSVRDEFYVFYDWLLIVYFCTALTI